MATLLVLVPFAAVVLLSLLPRRLGNRLALGFAALLCVAEALLTLSGQRSLAEPLPFVAELVGAEYPVDNLALVMFLSIAIVGLTAVLVAVSRITAPETRFRFANLLLLALAAMNGVVLAHDLFSLYVFLEVTAVTSFILIALERGKAAFEGAFKYLVLSAVATALIITGLGLLFVVGGDTSFAEVAQAVRGASTNLLVAVGVAVFLIGLAIKAGLVPFHGWLPDAYSAAPAPVSVLLAGIVTKTTGVYTLIRLVQAVFGFTQPVQNVLLFVGAVSIVVGALAALGQKDFKRMLAYSSISQVGYIILGLATGTALGMAGAVFHLFNHSIFKAQLFVNSSALEQQAGTTDMDRLGGIGGRMPLTSTTLVIAMLSTAGIPPAAGFWSKLLIILAVWKADFTAYAVVAVLASLLTLAYFLSVQRRVFFGKLAESGAHIREAGFWTVAPALVLAGITLGLGLLAPWLFQTFLLPIDGIL